MTTVERTSRLRVLFVPVAVMLVAGAALSDTYTVDNTDDSGDGSLRWAIGEANANPGRDLIAFNIPGAGAHTIQPSTPLPELTEEVVIDGYSQPGSAHATDTSNAVLSIILDGSLTSGDPHLHLGLVSLDPGASDCVITGLVIANYAKNGIFVESGANGNVIEGNYIESNQECGIFIKSANNRIGGTTPDARNVISANSREGIIIYGAEASSNEVLGNYVGTDASGMSYLPNAGIGVAINDAPDNVVGGTTLGSRNVISDVSISNPGAMNNRVVGNYIGIKASGDGSLSGGYADDTGVDIGEASHNEIGPNNIISGHLRGVAIWPGSSHNVVRDNYIGTDVTGQLSIGNAWDGVTIMGSHNRLEDNVVAASLSNGVYVARGWETGHEMPSQNIIIGNIIGMNASADVALPNYHGIVINTAVNTTISGNLIGGNRYSGVRVANDLPWNPGVDLAVGNRITQNAIYDNGTEGINLVPYDNPDGVTPNDEGDIDAGPNNLMNFPVLKSAIATPARLIVMGTIDTPEPMSITLEFFANSMPDDSGYGEGEDYLGAARPSTVGVFTAILPPLVSGKWISATATDGNGNTSEFALCFPATEVGKP